LTESISHERDERGVERYSDSNVKCAQQQQPVPTNLKDAVMQQNKARMPLFLHLVLRHGVTRQVLDLRRNTTCPSTAIENIGADSMGAMGTFAPVLFKILRREYSFAPVIFGLVSLNASMF